MKPIKVRNIGNSVGIILPKESGLTNGDIIQAKKSDLFILDTSEITRGHNRKLVEDSFADFEKELIVSKSKMKAIFGKYGWKWT